MGRITMTSLVVVVAAWLGGFAPGIVAQVAEVDPVLARVLSEAEPSATVSAFVVLRKQVDLQGMTAWLGAMHATRRFRHECVVRALRETAAAAQPPIASLLAEFADRGRVKAWTAFWIFNGFHVEATREAFMELRWRTDVKEMLWSGGPGEAPEDLIRPVFEAPSPNLRLAMSVESGLLECNAPYLWNLGFTGKGRVAANIDSGVDGNHSALKARWRGTVKGVPATAAWHDPINNTTFPSGRSSHGTHTMGTICGDDGASNQIGMAPGARWIASNVIDGASTRPQKNVLYNLAIQWMADPDGNPATVDDVPDAVGNSWGVRDPSNGVPPCATVFNASIDAAEAATVVFVFAAGNESTRGPRVPADRIASDTNTFSVGSLNPGSTSLSSFSSRGPSPCDQKTIKPEVSARGGSVRSSVPGDRYATMSGTSMATPHVAGAVVLLRDVWPEVTVDRVKRILMETAADLGSVGEDNLYGHGRIDCEAAYKKLVAERPAVAIRCMGTRRQWRMGETFRGHVSLTHYGAAPITVRIAIQFYFKGGPTSLIILPPVDVTLPGGFSNESIPLPVALGIPFGLSAAMLDPADWSLRGTIEPKGGGAVLHQSDYSFTITP